MSQPRMDRVSACRALTEAFEQFSTFTADHAHAAPRRVSVPVRGYRRNAGNRKAPPARRPEALNSLRRLVLPGDG
jgi:hypothetical protein